MMVPHLEQIEGIWKKINIVKIMKFMAKTNLTICFWALLLMINFEDLILVIYI